MMCRRKRLTLRDRVACMIARHLPKRVVAFAAHRATDYNAKVKGWAMLDVCEAAVIEFWYEKFTDIDDSGWDYELKLHPKGDLE